MQICLKCEKEEAEAPAECREAELQLRCAPLCFPLKSGSLGKLHFIGAGEANFCADNKPHNGEKYINKIHSLRINASFINSFVKLICTMRIKVRYI